MQFSNLSLIYIALSAFVTASVLVVHLNYADGTDASWGSSLSMGAFVPAEANPAETVMLYRPTSAIEM